MQVHPSSLPFTLHASLQCYIGSVPYRNMCRFNSGVSFCTRLQATEGDPFCSSSFIIVCSNRIGITGEWSIFYFSPLSMPLLAERRTQT